MKTVLTILVLSLAANAALSFIYLRNSRVAPGRAIPHRAGPPSPSPALANPSVDAFKPAPELVAAARSGEPHQLLAALRQAGFPENYVRDIVMWSIGDSLSAERLALLRADAARPFWKLGLTSERTATMEALRELDRRSRELSREVFGGRVPAHPLEADRTTHRYRFLPAGKVEAVSRIDSDYSELVMESRGEARSMPDPSMLRLLEQERRADLAKVLTPDELDLYDLYLSSSAESLRRQLGSFQPTEAEFRALFAIQRAADEKRNDGNVNLPGVTFIRTSSDQATREQIRAALEPSRAAELERFQDMGYRAAVEIAQHYSLPADIPEKVYQLQKQYQDRMRTPPAPDTDRAALLAARQALGQEAAAEFTRLLGPEGLDAYRQTGGTWLRALETATFQPAVRLPGGG